MGGVLFIDEAYYLYRQENERDYGQEFDRDFAAGDGDQSRRSRRDPRRLRRQDGPVLPLQPGLSLARRPSHRLSRLHRRRSRGDRREDARFAQLQAEPGGEAGARRIYSVAPRAAAVRQRALDPQRARPRPPASGQSPVGGRRPGIDSRQADDHRRRKTSARAAYSIRRRMAHDKPGNHGAVNSVRRFFQARPGGARSRRGRRRLDSPRRDGRAFRAQHHLRTARDRSPAPAHGQGVRLPSDDRRPAIPIWKPSPRQAATTSPSKPRRPNISTARCRRSARSARRPACRSIRRRRRVRSNTCSTGSISSS